MKLSDKVSILAICTSLIIFFVEGWLNRALSFVLFDVYWLMWVLSDVGNKGKE